MERIKIRFESFAPDFKKEDNFFLDILKERYHVTLLSDSSNEEPDVLFYSFFGQKHLRWWKCIRIYYTGEADFPNFNLCDYALGFYNLNMPDRYLRFPLYIFYHGILKRQETRLEISRNEALDRDFCSIVVSASRNSHPMRMNLFDKLNEYKQVASGGKWRNTVGGPVADKIEFIKNYKFNLAIENIKVDGYTTEKICEPFVANTVPIYWGNGKVAEDFDGGYINISDFSSLDEAVAYIKEVDSNDDLYMSIVNTLPTKKYTYQEWCELFLDFFDCILEKGKIIQDFAVFNDIYNEACFLNKMRNSRFVMKYMRKLYPLIKL